MARILILPAPAIGHINPTFRLARVARSAGHEVVYSSFDEAEAPVRAEGFPFVPVFGALPRDEELPWSYLGASRLKGMSQLRFFRQIALRERRLNQAALDGGMERMVAEQRPDLLLCDAQMVHARIIAHGLRVPMLVLNTTFPATWPPPPEGSVLKRWAESGLTSLVHHLLAAAGLPSRVPGQQTLKALARRHGYPLESSKTEPLGFSHTETSELVLTPREFLAHDEAQAVGHWHYIGPCIDLERQEPDFPWERLEASRPLVLLSPGTNAFSSPETLALFRLCLRLAALRPEWQFVLSTGSAEMVAELGAPPANLIIVPHAPQLGLLRRATAMVTHGGFNSVKECIYFGVPMVVLPQRADQPRVAGEVERHGLGVCGALAGLDAPALLGLLDDVLSRATVRTALDAMSARFQETNTEAFVSATLERFLTQPGRTIAS